MSAKDNAVKLLTMKRSSAIQKVLKIMKADQNISHDHTGAEIVKCAPLFTPTSDVISNSDRERMVMVAREIVKNQSLYEGVVLEGGGTGAKDAWKIALEYFMLVLKGSEESQPSSVAAAASKEKEDKDDDDDDDEDDEEEEEEESNIIPVKDTAREPKTWAEVSGFLSQEAVSNTTGGGDTGGEGEVQKVASVNDMEAEETFKDALGLLKEDQVSDMMHRIIRAWVLQGHDEHSCTVDITSECFDPALYLATLHARTPFSALRTAGVRFLDAQIDSRAEAIKTLVRQNFDLFVKCKDAMDSVHRIMRNHEFKSEEKLGPTSAKVISSDMQHLEGESKAIFDQLLQNQREAERIRSLLFALDKSKYLFKLPGALRAAVARGDDERVVEVYHRAREMLSATRSPLFRTIMTSCNNVVIEYRKQLFAILEDPSASVAKIEEVTAALGQLALEFPVEDKSQADPLRFYFTYHIDRVTKLLRDCVISFHTQVTGPVVSPSAQSPLPSPSKPAPPANTMPSNKREQILAIAAAAAAVVAAKRDKERKEKEQEELAQVQIPRETLDMAYREVSSHVHDMAVLLQQSLPQLCRVAKLFGAMDSDDGAGFEELEIEAEDAEEGVVRAVSSVKKKRRLPDAIKYIPAQKHRVVDVLIGNDTWAKIRIRKNQTSALFFQQLLDYLRKRCGISAAPNEYGLYTVTSSKGSDNEIVKEMHPYDKPYQIHKQWTKNEKGYFLFRRRRIDVAAISSTTVTKVVSNAGMRFFIAPEVVAKMISQITTSFSEKALSVFLPGRDDDDPPEVMTFAGRILAMKVVSATDLLRSDALVRHDRVLQQCIEELEAVITSVKNEGVPEAITNSLEATLDKMKQRYARQVCAECREITAALARFEDWKPTADGSHTALPLVFSTIFKDLFRLVSRVAGSNRQMISSISESFVGTIQTFLDTLHYLVFPPSSTQQVPLISGTVADGGDQNGPDGNTGNGNESVPQMARDTQQANSISNMTHVDLNEKLQRVLANCLLCRNTVFPDLERIINMSKTDQLVQRVRTVVTDLENLCLSHYIALHTARVTKIVQNSVPRLIREDNATTDKEITTVPAFAMSFMLEVVHVHSDTESVSPNNTDKLMTTLYVHFVRTVRNTVVSCPGRLSSKAVCDIFAGVEFARTVLPLSPGSPGVSQCLEILVSSLKALCPNAPDPESVHDIVDANIEHTSRLFSCFSV